ncbi:hypothetical protein FACS1894172_14900 [Spirochaetia bacterium]|nr:hypothetical protein FACS1894172_14900 [Spirochaetia bacterium]
MIADQIIQTICPPLATSESLPMYLQMAREMSSKRFFGSMYEYAIAYLACHFFTVFGDSTGAGGALDPAVGTGKIASKSEGGMSISYAQESSTGAAGSEELSTTKFGKLYLALRIRRPAMGVNTSGCERGFL